MKISEDFGWVSYQDESNTAINIGKCGKWMYFFKDTPSDMNFVFEVCSDVVEQGIIKSAKHTDAQVLAEKGTGVACFYFECDDIETHKKIISFFIDNNMIRKTKSGKFYDISFKLDYQTLAGEYGEKFRSDLKLSHFIDLFSGEWLI